MSALDGEGHAYQALNQLIEEQMMAFFGIVFGEVIHSPQGKPVVDLRRRPLTMDYQSLSKREPSPGRRLRVFSALARMGIDGTKRKVYLREMEQPLWDYPDDLMSYGQALHWIEQGEQEACLSLSSLPFRWNPYSTDRQLESIPEDYVRFPADHDPELHPCLEDLAHMIVQDLTEACEALDDPDMWYPGVDEGIEPVTDDHVNLVIWASQRELDRELRQGKGTTKLRPAVQLTELPFRIQRAFAERRRLRYQEWGLGRKQYESNTFSLWDVPEDAEWVPPWISE